ncbi:MAG: hypothetical protein ACK5OX_14915 [Desertimonas sp.]
MTGAGGWLSEYNPTGVDAVAECDGNWVDPDAIAGLIASLRTGITNSGLAAFTASWPDLGSVSATDAVGAGGVLVRALVPRVGEQLEAFAQTVMIATARTVEADMAVTGGSGDDVWYGNDADSVCDPG